MDPNLPVKEIMSTELFTVSPADRLDVIKQLFETNTFHHLPVVEEGNRIVGIVSRMDLLKLFQTLSWQTTGKTWTQKEMENITAKDVMTQYPMQLDPEDSIGLAADIFLANQFHALPIVEDDVLVGIITSHDLVVYAFRQEVEVVNFK